MGRLERVPGMFYHETMGTMADQSKLYKTFSFRVQDSTSGKKLVRLGTKVNFVWNYCNDVSKRSAQRVGPWVGKKQLIDLTKGSSKEIGLPSQIVQNVVFEFIKSRKAAGKTFRLWMHRELSGRIKSGNFSQDSRGRWYCNLVCEVEAPKTTNRTKVVGIDLGFKTVASSSDGRGSRASQFLPRSRGEARRRSATQQEAAGEDHPREDQEPAQGRAAQVFPRRRQRRRRGVRREYLVHMASRLGQRQGRARRQLVDVEELPPI